MNRPATASAVLRNILLCGLLAAGFHSPAHGQITALKKIVEAQEPGKTKAPEKPEDVRARLEAWNQQAQDALDQLNAAGAETALPEGITPAELDSRRRDLETTALLATRSIKNLSAVADARKTLEASRAAADWSGFTEKPPYSLLLVDELLNERDAVKDKLASYQSTLSNYQGLLASTLTETKAAEDAANSMIGAVQNGGNNQVAAGKWRLEAARAKSRVSAVRATLLQSGCESFKDLIAAAELDLALLDRKVKAAKENAVLSEADLAKLEKISSERKKAIQKELDGISKRIKTAQAAQLQAHAALDELSAKIPTETKPGEIELAKFRAETADVRMDSLQSLTESFDSLIQLENFNWKVYQERRNLIVATTPADRGKALEAITVYSDRLHAWQNVMENQISTCGAELSKLESRATSIASGDPRFSCVNEQRSAWNEQLALLQRLRQAVFLEGRLIDRWIADYSPKAGETGFYERASGFCSATWETAKKVWAFEVMSYDSSVEVDGQVIPGKIPVTLGMLLRAILFFAIGYWIASRIANRIQSGLVRHGHIADAQARTLRNWAMIVVGVFLVLGTLAFLRIPLTVFAYFGGALAIGLGFGLQTLIKNFISGIIVLVERKVRVGDILDVDGIIGTVVEVNTRSSVIRSADDVETMIPNSVFLENRVTNWTLSTSHMRRAVRVGVAYGTSPQTVIEALVESAGRHGLICKEPVPFAIFEDFGDSALMFCLYFWVNMSGQGNAMVIASDLRLMIEKRFHELGISIPFPQRDVHLTSEKPLQVEWAPPPGP